MEWNMEENCSMEWNMEENFSMEWNMEWKIFSMEWKIFSMEWKIFSMEWKIFSMEWKKIARMEYRKIVFHSIPCPAHHHIRKNFKSAIFFGPTANFKWLF